MPICNWSGDPAMDAMFAPPVYIALMNGDPTQSGSLTQEMTGGGYVRKPCTFGAANGRSVSNTTVLWWADLTTTPIRYIAVVNALTGGNMIAYVPTPSDIVVPEGKKYVIDASDLAFTIT